MLKEKKNILMLVIVVLVIGILLVIGIINTDNDIVDDSGVGVDTDEKIDDEVDNEDVDLNKRLVFSIYSARLNCYTIRLDVYDDNTYKFGNINGTYTYDISKIFDSVDKYEETKYGPFILTDSDGNEFYLYDNNIELMDFLESIDVSLDTCMIVQ